MHWPGQALRIAGRTKVTGAGVISRVQRAGNRLSATLRLT